MIHSLQKYVDKIHRVFKEEVFKIKCSEINLNFKKRKKKLRKVVRNLFRSE